MVNTFLANTAIELAVAALLGSFAGLLTAIAGWFNARARLLDHGVAIAQLQAQANSLLATQAAGVAHSVAAAAPQPTIITLPAPAPAPAPAAQTALTAAQLSAAQQEVQAQQAAADAAATQNPPAAL